MTAIYREQNSAVENNKKTWSGRFNEPVSELVERYTASIGFDQRLAEYDIQGSLAHAQMLATQGIISHADRMAIEQGLNQIREEIRNHQFVWQQALEDVHLNIEKRLTALVGDAGKRLQHLDQRWHTERNSGDAHGAGKRSADRLPGEPSGNGYADLHAGRRQCCGRNPGIRRRARI